MKNKIKVATSNTRGFLRNLFDNELEDFFFEYDDGSVYEISGNMRNFLASAVKFPIFDFFGIFQVVEVLENDCDLYFSYNRFLRADKPYIIFLENPSALVNYCWERPKHLITRYRLKKLFTDEKLKGIVCMSKACYRHMNDLYSLPDSLPIYQVYPFICDDLCFDEIDVKCKATAPVLECLFVSSDFNLKGGGDILEVCKLFKQANEKIHISCVTKKSTVSEHQIEEINNLDNIDIIEFNLSKKELDNYYKKASVLLNPTRLDSYSLVTLEAMKYGCALIATDIYAIKEMVHDGINGFLGEPMYKVWDEDGKLNKKIRRNKRKTVYSGRIDWKLVSWMGEKLTLLAENRELLYELCMESLHMARNENFSQKSISGKWNEIFNSALEDGYDRNNNVKL